MEITRKDGALRLLAGGVCGLLVMLLAALLANSFSIQGGAPDYSGLVLVGHGAQARFGSYGLALAVQSGLCFGLGAAAGAATLPFAGEGRSLAARSLLHVGVTGTLYALLLVLCLDVPLRTLPAWLGMLGALYLVVWLGRWVGWCAEAAAIREKLGLAPGPSPLKWRETAPYLPFVVLVCGVLPPVLRLLDPPDVPVLTGLLLPYLLLPAAGLVSGAALGKRQGVCPLYPVACFLCYLPMVFLLFNSSALFHCWAVSGSALLGNLLGAAYRRRKK